MSTTATTVVPTPAVTTAAATLAPTPTSTPALPKTATEPAHVHKDAPLVPELVAFFLGHVPVVLGGSP